MTRILFAHGRLVAGAVFSVGALAAACGAISQPSATGVGKPCGPDAGPCAAGLVCDVNGSQASGRGGMGGSPLVCLKSAGSSCSGDEDCLSADCKSGSCGLSPTGFSCGTDSDCSVDAGYGSTVPAACTPGQSPAGPVGECCPVNTGGAQPGCPGA